MFCILEHDLKTYQYFQRYIECFEGCGNSLEFDNRIQAEELSSHLRVNGFNADNTQEKLNWIAINGRPFREYINTIKLIYVICKVQGIDPHAISQDHFFEIEAKLNEVRHCLFSIF